MTLARRLATVGLACALVGCASSPPESAYYLLRAEVPPGSTPADPNTIVGFGTVSVAPYLDRAGVVVQLDDHRVREARYHLWAEPLEYGIRLYLADRVSAAAGRPLAVGRRGALFERYRIDVAVEELHGTLNGEVTLTARFGVWDLRSDRLVVAQRFAARRSQSGDGYPGLVATQVALLDDLAQAIARELGTLDLDSSD